MMRYQVWVLGFVQLVFCDVLFSQDIRYRTINGQDYKEVIQKVQVPETQTTYSTRTEKFYREQYTTEMQESQRVFFTPVTEYRWEAYTPFSLNPFAPPRVAYRWVPKTHWEQRSESVKTPVTRRELVPGERIVTVPQTTLRMVEREQITRVPVLANQIPNRGPIGTSTPGAIGGVANLQDDPPRLGTLPAGSMSTLRR